MIVGMKAHRMRPAEPTHEPAHFAIEQRAYNQVVMIGHQLIGVQFDLMNLQRFMQNPLERLKVGVLVKDRRAQVAAIEGMVKSARFIGPGWSGQGLSLQSRKPPT
jgi:hypothetical protein